MARHNLGVSGNTTADVLERFDLLEAARPRSCCSWWARTTLDRTGAPISHRMATTQETERDLLALIELITIDLGASVRLITPPAVDHARISAFFADMPLQWSPDSVAEVADTVRKVIPAVSTSTPRWRRTDSTSLFEPDGVHPNHTGQQFILRNVLAALHADRPS